MPNGKITYFLVIFQAVFIENKLTSHKSESILTRLVNVTNSSHQPTTVFPENPFRFVLLCERNESRNRPCANGSGISPVRNSRQSRQQVRWTKDVGRISSTEALQMAEPSRKSADFHLVTDDREDEFHDYKPYNGADYNGEPEEDDEDEDEEEGEDGEEEEDDAYSFDFLESDEKPSKKKTKKEKNKNSYDEEEEEEEEEDDDDDTPQLKHLFKHKLKMKDLMFLLLLAYKLKFVTLIPLFLGALILLVGATSMAGFFFALFSAALGLQSKHR